MRNKDIVSTLSYVEDRKQELSSLIFNAGMSRDSVKNIANLTADILSNLTNCFDYCAKDVYDKYIFSGSGTNKIEKKRIYFPFVEDQLTNRNQIFNSLFERKKVLFDFLIVLVERIKEKKLIEDIDISYSIVKEVRDLVNDHKHNKVIVVDKKGPLNLLAQNEMINISIPENQLEQGGLKIELLPGQEKKTQLVRSYRFVQNDRDVKDFCWDAELATGKILDEIYRKFFSVKILGGK